MKTFSTVAITILSVAGLASAQQPATPATPAKPATPAAGTAAKPATPATPAKPATAAKPATDPAASKPAEMTPPKPPAEIAAFAKGLTGTWRCTGQGMNASMTMVPMKATMKTKADLDGWWIQDSFEGTMGKAKYKMTAYTTYDASSKKWRRLSVDNMGSQMIGASDGLKDNKVVFNLDTMGGGMSAMFRDTTDLTDAKNVKAWGEMSMDKGKTWTKAYEVSCKK